MSVSTEPARLPSTQAVADVPFWIDGARATAESVRRGEVSNPSTGAVIRTVPLASAADVDRAVQSAAAAFPGL